MLIVIEGPDGSGKTTLINILKERFGMFKFITPFDTEYGKLVKSLLSNPLSKDIDNTTKSDLMSRSIRSTFNEIINENPNEVFITDRWAPSYYVYQEASTYPEVTACHRQYFDYLTGIIPRPNYSFYLDGNSDVLINRITKRNQIDELDKYAIQKMDRIVSEYRSYRHIHDDSLYYQVLDVEESPMGIASQVTKYLRMLLV